MPFPVDRSRAAPIVIRPDRLPRRLVDESVQPSSSAHARLSPGIEQTKH